MNIIFDTNFLLHKNVQWLHKINRLYGDLYLALETNVERLVALNKWDNVFIVSDSKKKSWRQQDLDDEYKGTRTKNQDIDWKFVYETYNDFKNEIGQKYTVLERDHIEGDDWITALVYKYNKKGIGNFIVSSDQDLLQLLHFKLNKDKSYINIQSNDKISNEKIFVPVGYELWMDEYSKNRNSDVFNLDNSYYDLNFFQSCLNKFEIIEVDNNESLFKKLVMGDKGDNVPCPYKTLTKTGKERGIGKAGADKIWNHFSENYDVIFDTGSDEFTEAIVESIQAVNKVDLSESRFNQVKNNIKSNIKLMELHYKHYPEWVLNEIIDEMNEKIFQK